MAWQFYQIGNRHTKRQYRFQFNWKPASIAYSRKKWVLYEPHAIIIIAAPFTSNQENQDEWVRGEQLNTPFVLYYWYKWNRMPYRCISATDNFTICIFISESGDFIEMCHLLITPNI